jgi:hypothetical protein
MAKAANPMGGALKKVKRRGKAAKTKTSSSRGSKNYAKKYRGQGR